MIAYSYQQIQPFYVRLHAISLSQPSLAYLDDVATAKVSSSLLFPA